MKVTFVPQAWINDYAVEADPQGEHTFEVPDEAVVGIEPDTYESDDLRHYDTAPQWIKDWSGPFYITWEKKEPQWIEND